MLLFSKQFVLFCNWVCFCTPEISTLFIIPWASLAVSNLRIGGFSNELNYNELLEIDYSARIPAH